MKLLLILLPLFLCICNASSQITWPPSQPDSDIHLSIQLMPNDPGINYMLPITLPRVDTIKSIFLATYILLDKTIFTTIEGYEIIWQNCNGDISFYYLDDKKNPLNKNITVWISKEIENEH